MPNVTTKRKRERRLVVMVSQTEREEIDRLCEELGITISDAMRRGAFQYMEELQAARLRRQQRLFGDETDPA